LGIDARARERIALDDALKLLAEVDPHKAQVIELRFFGGLTQRCIHLGSLFAKGSFMTGFPRCPPRLATNSLACAEAKIRALRG
jgi:hypothetical protein